MTEPIYRHGPGPVGRPGPGPVPPGAADAFSVDPDQIRVHASHIQELAARFGAVVQASAHIAQDDSAYGLLCGWISAILEGRHLEQDELIAIAQENLSMVVDGLQRTADEYEAVDAGTASEVEVAGGGLGE